MAESDDIDDDATPEVVELPSEPLAYRRAPLMPGELTPAAKRTPTDPIAAEVGRAITIAARVGRRLAYWFAKRTLKDSEGKPISECPTCKGPVARPPNMEESIALREYSAMVHRLAAEQRHRVELVHKYKLKPMLSASELRTKVKLIVKAELLTMSEDEIKFLLEERYRALAAKETA